MANKYYIKLRVNYEDNFFNHLAVIPVFAFSENEARKKAISQVENWENFTTALIDKISFTPIYIYNYVVEAEIKYQNGSTKILKFNVTAENEDLAEEEFRAIVSKWNHIVSIEIFSVEYRTKQPKQN